MPRERDPPYVAAGFRNDAQKLLDQFVAKRSLKFVDFAEVWRDLHFSTIFMGREGLRELTEFIEECYRNTLLFMDASDPYQKVGVVYLLYSLYMKQPPFILKSQIPIRINHRQVFEIYNLENHFLDIADGSDDVLDLTYIVTKLFKTEAFSISCFPIPMGPAVPIPLLKLEPLRNSCFKEMLGAFRMLNESDIKNTSDLSKSYEELKKHLPVCSTYTETQELNKFDEIKETIDKLEYHYNSGVFPHEIRTLYPNKVPESQCGETFSRGKCGEPVMMSSDAKLQKEFRSLGERRAMLKAQQFEMDAEFNIEKRVRSSSESSESSPPTPVKRKRGRPKKLKKPGRRGRKKKVDEEVAGSEFGAAAGRDNVPVENNVVDAQTEAEDVDNPEGLHPVPYFPYRRPSKYPRPARKLYFQNKEDKDEDCC